MVTNDWITGTIGDPAHAGLASPPAGRLAPPDRPGACACASPSPRPASVHTLLHPLRRSGRRPPGTRRFRLCAPYAAPSPSSGIARIKQLPARARKSPVAATGRPAGHPTRARVGMAAHGGSDRSRTNEPTNRPAAEAGDDADARTRQQPRTGRAPDDNDDDDDERLLLACARSRPRYVVAQLPDVFGGTSIFAPRTYVFSRSVAPGRDRG